jgi:hypothetical protein
MIQRRVGGLILVVFFLALGCEGDVETEGSAEGQPIAELEPRSVAGSVAAVTPETISVVRLDTIQTIAFDTVRTVVYDTVRVEQHVMVYDTVRVATPVSEPDPVLSPKETIDPQELITMKDGLSQGHMPERALAAIVGKTPEFSTVSLAQLDSVQSDLIAHVFSVPGVSLKGFRWGSYPAPKNTDLTGKTFLTVWVGTSDESRSTILVDSTGQIAQR